MSKISKISLMSKISKINQLIIYQSIMSKISIIIYRSKISSFFTLKYIYINMLYRSKINVWCEVKLVKKRELLIVLFLIFNFFLLFSITEYIFIFFTNKKVIFICKVICIKLKIFNKIIIGLLVYIIFLLYIFWFYILYELII